MESGHMPTSNIDNSIRNSVRYTLVHKMMEENFCKWLSSQNTTNLIFKLIEDCKKPQISMSTPSPLFVTKPNLLTQSQALNSFMPPVSPNASAILAYNSERKNMLTESQILREDKRRVSESISGNVMTSLINENKNIIPQFYFGEKHIHQDIIDSDNVMINKIFSNGEISIEEFVQVTEEFLEFPKLFNMVLFKKIQPEGNKMSKTSFLKFHEEHFQGKDEYKKFFNLLKSKNQNFIQKSDLMPFIRALLTYHPGLDFLKSHPDFQDKYADTVIMRIFYTCDLNDDGKINYREFRKSNLITVLRKVCEEPDINKVRDYFSYEHFYVLYCIFWKLDGVEHDFLIDKEDFSKYDGHSLSRKAVDRIFSGIPRKFKSGYLDKMGFEDFVWYLLCEEDKTSRTSIEYWFKVLDLDNNGIVTPHEMQYFYDEQVHRMQYLDNETVNFNDIICQLYDNIKPELDHQFTLKNFLDNKCYASIFLNNILNLSKFINHEQKDPFSMRNDIERNSEYTDWDKFAFYEYQRLTADDMEEGQETNDSGLLFDENEASPNNNNI